MYAAGTHQAALLTKLTRPSGSVYAQVTYDPLTGRVTSDTDSNGGTWTLHAPTASGLQPGVGRLGSRGAARLTTAGSTTPARPTPPT